MSVTRIGVFGEHIVLLTVVGVRPYVERLHRAPERLQERTPHTIAHKKTGCSSAE